MSDHTSPLPYRPCVGVALFNGEGKVFVGERIDTPGAWQMPQGGIDEGEDIEAAALRELQEEIGTNKAELIKIHDHPIRYDLPEHLRAKLWNGKYRGQKQTWVAMRFTGADGDIDLNADDHPEFSAWQWVELDKTLDLIVSFKRKTYEEVIGIFSDLV
ncbi:MAG: RNA pyrophosphohydrolase [Alphaproteobacteria bacterium]|nr:RNA pyrophosphohydrolase [Alphaproteobacteria bacterium]